MNKLIAKPIIDEHYWIVTDGNKKIGNIKLSNHNIYEVTLSGNSLNFPTMDSLTQAIKISFQKNPLKKLPEIPYPDYPTPKQIFNSMADIQRGLHLFTKNKKSKCYYAAGYFIINFGNTKEVVFCPKYIFIQRYNYQGPFKTKDEALANINN